jgi:dihydrodipicolinate synthase/N-acetylneuraminate lyase
MFGNNDPQFVLKMHATASSYDLAKNQEQWVKLLPLYKYVYAGAPYHATDLGKEMARIAGRPMGSYERLPLRRPNEAERAQLRKVMEIAGMKVA